MNTDSFPWPGARLPAVVLAAALVGGCASTSRTGHGGAPAHAAVGQDPEIFAPGVISSAAPEFSIAFTADEKTLYFTRASADRSSLTIMTSEWRNGRWSDPVAAPFSGKYRDVDPFVSPDGRRIYFNSNRPRSAGPTRPLTTWYVERTTNGWSDPMDPGAPLDSDSTDVFISLARDGTAVFSSTRDGRSRIYSTRLLSGRWETPHPIRFGSVEQVGNALISPSGRFVVLSVGQGKQSDLYVSCRSGQSWSEPRSLGPRINSAFADFAPALTLDESVLYFTSERPGIVGAQPDSIRPPGDIYRVRLDPGLVGCP